MATLVDAFVGLSWLVSLILDITAAVYCFKIKQITGGFRAWWLMIVFAILFAVSSFTSVTYSVVSSVAVKTSISEPAITNTALFDIGLNLALSLLLVGAMVELYWVFSRHERRRPQEAPMMQATP